jgi:hypothetical protein
MRTTHVVAHLSAIVGQRTLDEAPSDEAIQCPTHGFLIRAGQQRQIPS